MNIDVPKRKKKDTDLNGLDEKKKAKVDGKPSSNSHALGFEHLLLFFHSSGLNR